MKRLLDRQQKQVQETQELIQNLQDEFIHRDLDQNELFSMSNSNSTETLLERKAPSIATSLLSGFDYGFVSRSEGCRFENVNDFNE